MSSPEIEAAKREIEARSSPITKKEPEYDVKAAITDLFEIVNRITQEIAVLKTPSTPQTVEPTFNNLNQFSQIEGFARAMGTLKEYENKVISGYKLQQSEIKTDIMAVLDAADEESESAEDTAIKMLINKFGDKIASSPDKPAPVPVKQVNPIVPNQRIIGGDIPMETKDEREIIDKIPEQLKDNIKSGKVSLEQVKTGLTPEILKSLGIKESEIDNVYKAIKEK